MTTNFNGQYGLIVVPVTLHGPTGIVQSSLALDTGSSSTVISKAMLVSIGYDPDAQPKSVSMTTGSSVEAVSRLTVDKVEALDQERLQFSVVAHTLPPSMSVDGVLGLDFFRNRALTLDFQNGLITLST